MPPNKKKKTQKRAETTGDFVGLVHVHEPLIKRECRHDAMSRALPYPVFEKRKKRV